MDIAEAATRLKLLTAAEVEPTLSETVIAQLLSDARIVDSDGNYPSSADWVETYDIYRAAAEGWLYKAAQVAGDFTFAIDGQSFSRAQAFQHFTQQAKYYKQRSRSGLGTIEITNPRDGGSSVDLLWA